MEECLEHMKATDCHVVRGSYENLGSKLLPNNFFTNMFVKVCTNIP